MNNQFNFNEKYKEKPDSEEKKLLEELMIKRQEMIKKKEEKEKEKMKTMKESEYKEMKRIESETIHQIAYDLRFQNTLITKSKVTGTIGKYRIEKGRKYEILSVDFRINENYIFMREYSKETIPLFEGKPENIFDRDVHSTNYSEYLRRGYYDCGELFMRKIEEYEKEMKGKDYEEKEETFIKTDEKEEWKIVEFVEWLMSFCDKRNKELKYEIEEKKKKERKELNEIELIRKGIIEIPISLYLSYFEKYLKMNKNVSLKKEKRIVDVKGQYTKIFIKSKRITNITIRRNSNYPMTLRLFETGKGEAIIKRVYNEKDFEPFYYECISDGKWTNGIKLIIELPEELKYKEGLTVEIESEYDESFSINEISHVIEEYERHILEFKETEEKCELCGLECNFGKELFTKIEGKMFHPSCYDYLRCCKCHNKKVKVLKEYIPEMKGLICEDCFPDYFYIPPREEHMTEDDINRVLKSMKINVEKYRSDCEERSDKDSN